MAPKAKKGKKQADNWENELGEDATAATATDGADSKAPQEAGDDEFEGGGASGLLAALKKNKEKRKKKGKQDNDFVEGEDIAALVNANGEADEVANKAPEEATFDDEEDIFAGKKGKKGPLKQVLDDDDNSSVASGDVGGGGVKSKKEKEKEKKEREKQRKKEQVCSRAIQSVCECDG